MSIKFNPFMPDKPVHIAMFVGRLGELKKLESVLSQTRLGNPKNFLITGERGIGKSSLLLYVQALANGAVALNGNRLKFMVVFTDVDKATTQLSLVQKIELGLRQCLSQNEKVKVFFKSAWDFIQRIDSKYFSLKSGEKSSETETIIEQFAYSLAETANKACSDDVIKDLDLAMKYDGVIILLDEVDNASEDLRLGSFLKLLNERLQRRSCNRVMFGLAGLPQIKQILLKSHQSSLRMFDLMELQRLSREETGEVIDLGLKLGNEKNERAMEIDTKARDWLIGLAEGYPHFIQQYCYSAFEKDTDWKIDYKDVLDSAFGRGGALDLIGERYYKEPFYNRIQKESYRQVLRIMAEEFDSWMTKKEIASKFKGSQETLNNALHALYTRGIILRKEGEKGVYRLQHKGFALWIKLKTSTPQEIEQFKPEATAVQEISQ